MDWTQFGIIFGATASIFAVVAVGAVLRRVGWLTEEADASMLKVIINVMLPCLILDKVIGNERLADVGSVLITPILAYGTIVMGLVLGIAVARAIGRRMGLDSAEKRRTFALCLGINNYGYVPLPLAELLFDEATIGVLLIYIVGVDLALWTAGLVTLHGRLGRDAWKHLITAPTIAILVALSINAVIFGMGFAGGAGEGSASAPAAAAGVAEGAEASGGPTVVSAVTGSLMTGIGLLGRATVPTALLLIGATIMDQLVGGRAARLTGWSVMTAACVLRLGVLPLMFLAMVVWLPISVDVQRILVLQAAMPCAVFPIVMSRVYGGDPPTALRVVISTSLVGLITAPLWIALGLGWIGG